MRAQVMVPASEYMPTIMRSSTDFTSWMKPVMPPGNFCGLYVSLDLSICVVAHPSSMTMVLYPASISPLLFMPRSTPISLSCEMLQSNQFQVSQDIMGVGDCRWVLTVRLTFVSVMSPSAS